MSITVKKIALTEQTAAAQGKLIADNHWGLIDDVEVNCFVRIGTLTLTVAALRQLKAGEILTLQQKTDEPLDIMLNNQVIARGELMSCEENFAIKITEVCS